MGCARPRRPPSGSAASSHGSVSSSARSAATDSRGTRSRSRRSRIAPSRPPAALLASCATRAAKRGGPLDEAPSAHCDRRRDGCRRVRLVRRPVSDLAALRPNDLPRPGRGANHCPDLRRRPEPAVHRVPDGSLGAPRRPCDLPGHRPVGRTRAGPPSRPGRGRARARQSHLVAPDDAAPLADAGPRGVASLPRGRRSRRADLLERRWSGPDAPPVRAPPAWHASGNREAGYNPLLWSITCYDWRRTATVDKLVQRAGRARDGDIILLHDGSDAEPAADRAASVAATDEVLGRLTAEGYRFVTVPEMVGEAAQPAERRPV